MFRPQIKVVDCTIRDGGLANNSNFELETVRAVYKACCEAGVDYVELGYRNSKKMFSPEKFGPWRFCDEEALKKVIDGIDPRATKISVMQDAHKADADDVLPKDKSVVDMIRVATYVKDIDKAIKLANNATDKGYESTINIMAISHEGSPFLDEALQQIEEETKVLAVYIVDSFGALYSETVHYLVEKFQHVPQDQGNRRPRPQQPATGLRQHHRGHHPRAPTTWTARCTAWAGRPATARWNCCWGS